MRLTLHVSMKNYILKVNKNMVYLELTEMENDADRSSIELSIKDMKEQLENFSELKRRIMYCYKR